MLHFSKAVTLAQAENHINNALSLPNQVAFKIPVLQMCLEDSPRFGFLFWFGLNNLNKY